MIEIIAHPTCPTCDGNGRFYDRDADDFLQCSSCNGVGTVPRVLATFADAAEFRKKVNNAVGFSIGDLGSVSGTTVRSVRDAVLAELGIDDHPQPPALVD